MGSIVKSPSEIIADEVGAVKAATVLAALRGQGWEVVPHKKKPTVNVREKMEEMLRRQAEVPTIRPAKRKYLLPAPRWPQWGW